MLTKPTVRFRRNPMEVVADLLRVTVGTQCSMRGLHSLNVAPSDIGTWTVGHSLASLRDDFMVFTPGSQPLIRRTIDGFKIDPFPAQPRPEHVNWVCAGKH